MSITPNSKFALTLTTAVMCVLAIVGATWRLANSVRDVRDELKTLRAYAWMQRDQERWAYELERTNRDLKLFVPKVPERSNAN